jgi:ABC-type amino acid transport substrate-binding protein
VFFSGGIQGQVSHVFEPTKFENSTSSILAQSSDSTDTMKFGYLPDAFPVSYEKDGKRLIRGYCGKLKDYLDKEGYKFKEQPIPGDKRFTKYEGITVECSANTITQKRVSTLKSLEVSDYILQSLAVSNNELKSLTVPKRPKHTNEFSKPFFQTGAKIIIRNESRSHLDKVTSGFRIGVMSNTTTESIGSSIYPNATVVKVDDRANAINRLQLTLKDEKAIDAFISDEILLSTILSELPSNSYSIEPKAYGFSNESYGVVVYGNPELLKVINKWIGSKDGEEARKNELDSKARYNPISQGLSFLLSQDYFYNLVGFLLVFLPLLFLLLILTHPLFITLIAKFPLFTKFLSWMRRRELRGKISFVDHLIIRILHDEAFNVIIYKANNSLFPMFIDRETVVSVIKEVGQPFLHFNNGNEPSTVDVEKVAQNFAQQAESNPHFTKVLETLKDAATEETDKWIRSAVTRAFELLKQTIDPNKGTS